MCPECPRLSTGQALEVSTTFRLKQEFSFQNLTNTQLSNICHIGAFRCLLTDQQVTGHLCLCQCLLSTSGWLNQTTVIPLQLHPYCKKSVKNVSAVARYSSLLLFLSLKRGFLSPTLTKIHAISKEVPVKHFAEEVR